MPELPSDSTDEERAALYQAIGEATTAWAKVEDALCALFCFFVAGESGPGRPRSFPARAAFHAVINFNSRLAMVNAAAEWDMPTRRHLPTWHTLRNRVSRQVKRRNEIAHFALIRSGPIPFGPMRYYLMPSLENVSAHFSGEEPPKLTAADLRNRAASFRNLADALAQFAGLIGAVTRQALLPEYPAPPHEIDRDSSDTE